MVRRTERPARVEHRERMHDAIAEMVRAAGLRVTVGAPIVLEGRLCGVTSASWQREQSPPPDTEERMVQFAGPPSCPASTRQHAPRGRKLAGAPAFGTWQVGNKAEHSAPAAGGNVGCVSTTAGSRAPGRRTVRSPHVS
jgi:hypothetical protein